LAYVNRLRYSAGMSNLHKLRAGLIAIVVSMVSAPHAPAGPADEPVTRIVVHDHELHPVDDRLFGQFLEVASWGEPGPDAVADPDSGELPDNVVELLEWMQIPIIRWPAGTDMKRICWTDRIDGALNREGQGPRVPTDVGGNTVSNRVSHDAFLRLCERLGAEPIMVVNLEDALAGERTLDETKALAAAFVAYCNADPNDPDLSDELRAWAALRQTNGRTESWGVTYFHISNEVWFFVEEHAKTAGHTDTAAVAAWLADRVAPVAEAMKDVDPSIELIFDADLNHDAALTQAFYDDPRIAELIDFPTIHAYFPMDSYAIFRGDDKLKAADLGLEALWYLWQFGPGHWVEGELLASAPGWLMGGVDGPLAHTEWNWNGWGNKLGLRDHPREAAAASALAAASHLHGMIRQGDRFVIGNQSMLVGTDWNIAAIRVDPDGKQAPFLTPSGSATGLYARHHGDRRLAVAVDPMPVTDAVAGLHLEAWGNTRETGTPGFPLLDVVATADDDDVYVHVVHRQYEGARSVAIDLGAAGAGSGSAEVFRIVPRDDDGGVGTLDAVVREQAAAAVNNGVVNLELPAGSVSIVKVPRGE